MSDNERRAERFAAAISGFLRDVRDKKPPRTEKELLSQLKAAKSSNKRWTIWHRWELARTEAISVVIQ